MLELLLQQKETISVLANIVTAISFLAGMLFLWLQFRHQRSENRKLSEHQKLLTSAQMLASFVQQYDSEEFRKNRRMYALKMQKHLKNQRILQVHDHTMVGTFFENLAYMVNRGVLDKGMAINMFGWSCWNFYTILSLVSGSQSHIGKERVTLGSAYEELQKFADVFAKLNDRIDVEVANNEYIKSELNLMK